MFSFNSLSYCPLSARGSIKRYRSRRVTDNGPSAKKKKIKRAHTHRVEAIQMRRSFRVPPEIGQWEQQSNSAGTQSSSGPAFCTAAIINTRQAPRVQTSLKNEKRANTQRTQKE